MTSRIEKMATLVELAKIEEEKATQTYVTLQGQYKHHQQQLETLKDYVSDYDRPADSQQQGVSSVQMLSTQAFVAKLYAAIEAETAKVDSLMHTVERARTAWLEKRTRLQALEKLLVKFRQNRQVRLDKQEQKFLDELSSQKAAQKGTTTLF